MTAPQSADEQNHEKYQSYMRLVGKLEAAGAILKDSSQHVMIVDRRTRDLLEQADRLTNKAFLAAWEWAEELKRG